MVESDVPGSEAMASRFYNKKVLNYATNEFKVKMYNAYTVL